MEPVNVQFVGAPCAFHGSNTFYKAIKIFKNERYRILSLGEFFYMKILKDIPVCVGELQMIWNNKQENQLLLCSVRIYVLPEDSPLGRQDHHGEDEIMAVSDKLIIKASDLIPLITDNVEWSRGRRLFLEEEISKSEDEEFRNLFVGNNKGLTFSEVEAERKSIGDEGDKTSTELTILSYPQYCRYRAILRRLENEVDKWLRNAIICAVGGIMSKNSNNRIMFCKDMVDHPDFDELEIRCDHLAPSLKGRPRKKKSSNKSDSDSYETASDISTTPSSKSKEILRVGKRQSALRNGLKFDKSQVSQDEQEFLINLHKFMKKRNTPIGRIPSLGFKQIDLFFFYSYAQKLGGYEMVTQKRLWKHLYDKLGGNPGSTSAATCTRRHYEKLLLPYERYEKGRKIEKKCSMKNKKEKLIAKAKADMRKKMKEECAEGRPMIKKVARFKTTLTLKERALQWELLRRQKEKEKAAKGKRSVGRPRTVKNLLDSSEKKMSLMREADNITIKEEPMENKKFVINTPKIKYEKDGSDLSSNCSPIADMMGKNNTGSLFSQSKLFKHEAVQLTSSANSTDKKSSKPLMMDRPIPGITGHPQLPMYYPPTIIPVGPVPLGLSMMPHLPMGIPSFMHPAMQVPGSTEKQNKFQPNILRSSNTPKLSNSSSQSSSDQRSNTNSKHQSSASYSPSSTMLQKASPAHSHSKMHPASTTPSHSLIVPPAHSHSNKCSYSLSHPHIPGSSTYTSTNKSLLFDFESPKRHKTQNSQQKLNEEKSGSNGVSEQPTDLSMKTLRKIENEAKRESHNGSVTDFRGPSPKDKVISKESHQDFSVIGTPSQNLVKHSSASSLNSFEESSLHVFSNKNSSVFNPSTQQHGIQSSTEKSHTQASASMSIDHAAKIQGLDASPGMVHPAFLHPFMRPPVPQPGFFPTPLQLQQFYQAQIRASAAAQASALDGMLPRDCNTFPGMPVPGFVPQVPLYTHKDKK